MEQGILSVVFKLTCVRDADERISFLLNENASLDKMVNPISLSL